MRGWLSDGWRGTRIESMPGSWSTHELPHLTEGNCEITSDPARRYNCIAWAAGEKTRNWWPDQWGVGFWPSRVPRKVTVDAFIKAYETRGYRLCFDGSLQDGLEKVALYGKDISGTIVPTHAALQLESGEWTSKLGQLEDIRHATVDDVAGPLYGSVVCFLSRPRP